MDYSKITFVNNGKEFLEKSGNVFIQFPLSKRAYTEGEVLEFKNENFFGFLNENNELCIACRVMRHDGFTDITVEELMKIMDFDGVKYIELFTVEQFANAILGSWVIEYIDGGGKLHLARI